MPITKCEVSIKWVEPIWPPKTKWVVPWMIVTSSANLGPLKSVLEKKVESIAIADT
ncbi:MAG: hypothetical protein RL129_531 [Actinomycetota bacterium]